ncbi:MAG TPA: TIR domain-containing protein [Terriglobia bacterium]|nr:TIR domain-containing protein [Terriglobia bacterium]
MPFDVFISYSREDNIPLKTGDGKGWVTALRDELLDDHRRFSTEPLRIFLDTSDIHTFDDWRHRILIGLRESKLLLVCLSPDYFKNPACLWEWEEYQKRQVHMQMGQESTVPIYFSEVLDSDECRIGAWAKALTRRAVVQAERETWERRWKDWHAAICRQQWVDLRPWFPDGIGALRDTIVRERIADLGSRLWERIQSVRRAAGVQGNLRRLNPHFIGRLTELRQVHESVALGAVGAITVLHGLGGQGKSELATAYAHAWAGHYSGGLWALNGEGKMELIPLFGDLCVDLQIPFRLRADETTDARGRRALEEMKRRALAAGCSETSAGTCLVIIDNVSDPSLLAEPQLAQLPCEDWLRVLVTTREAPGAFSASGGKPLVFIGVDALLEDEAARLLEDHQPDGRWPGSTASADATAARAIARDLNGFTLAIETVAIYLGLHSDIRPSDYLSRLRAEGLVSVDTLPDNTGVARHMRHREKQLSIVIGQTLARLTLPERTALRYAALLLPDGIPWPWLQALVTRQHMKAFANRPGYPNPWSSVRRRLEGLRLVNTREHSEIASMHQLIRAYLLVREGPKIGDIVILDKLVMARSVLQMAVRGFLEEDWDFGFPIPLLFFQIPVGEYEMGIMVDFVLSRLHSSFASSAHAALAFWFARDSSFSIDSGLRIRLLEATLSYIREHEPEAHEPRFQLAALCRLGDLAMNQGKPSAARELFSECLAVVALHAARTEDSEYWEGERSRFMLRLGRIALLERDFEKAKQEISEGLLIAKRLASAHPEDCERQQEFADAEMAMGDVLAATGQPEMARKEFKKSVRMRRKTAEIGPSQSPKQRALDDYLEEFLSETGNPGVATNRYAKGLLELFRENISFVAQHPERQRQLATLLQKLCDGALHENDVSSAERYIEESLMIVRDLCKADPQNAELKADTMYCLQRLGDIFERVSNLPRALAMNQEALGLSRELVTVDGHNIVHQEDLAISLFHTGRIMARLGNEPEGRKFAVQAREILSRLDATSQIVPDTPAARLLAILRRTGI